MDKYNLVIDLINQKQLLEKELNAMDYGAIEVRTRNGHRYLYVHVRVKDKLYSKYVNEYSDSLFNVLKKNNIKAKKIKKELRRIIRSLKEFGYCEKEISLKKLNNIKTIKKEYSKIICNQVLLNGLSITEKDVANILERNNPQEISFENIMYVNSLKKTWDFILNVDILQFKSNCSLFNNINKLLYDDFQIDINNELEKNINNIINEDLREVEKALKIFWFLTKTFNKNYIDSIFFFINHYLISKGIGYLMIPRNIIKDFLLLLNEKDWNKTILFLKDECFIEFKNENLNHDLFKASIYGFIVGDALGVPIEFVSRDKLVNNYVKDMIDNPARKVTKGYWSDDTALILCTMKSIIDKHQINYKDIMNNFVKWVETGFLSADDICFGIGQTTFKALSFYRKEIKNPTISIMYTGNNENDWVPLCGKLSTTPNSKLIDGNGSLMRLLPVTLYLRGQKMSDNEKYQIIYNISQLTHYSKICSTTCIYYDIFVNNLLKSNDILSAIVESNKEIKIKIKDIPNELNALIEEKYWKYEEDAIKSSGYVIDTMQAVIWCLYNSESYEDAVLKAVNLGGDTDTIAAITGSLAGLYYGFDEIPKKWLSLLKKKEMLDEIVNKYLTIL